MLNVTIYSVKNKLICLLYITLLYLCIEGKTNNKAVI